ncbi:hypothetical protein MTR_8g028620 [Medicago truncatula]|uniref:Uncharacterized protein n=1 Tax=Medicago truncatula TaxID=3880 RepID=A0A072TMT5_MEDTR|nr:hypothetical protein MTR_8g028620 [Medicago truncatula]
MESKKIQNRSRMLTNSVYVGWVDHIHHLLNESKRGTFTCNTDRREYHYVFFFFFRGKCH